MKKIKCINVENCEWKKDGYCWKPRIPIKAPEYCIWRKMSDV